MNQYDTKVPKSYFVVHQDAWFTGIDMSMKTLGSAQKVTSKDLIKAQNAAIRDCWVVTGNHVRQAMIALSDTTNVYPEELKEDTVCRKMLTHKNLRV